MTEKYCATRRITHTHLTQRAKRQAFSAAIALSCFLTACAGSRDHHFKPPDIYSATVVYTPFGIPHITARDHASLGFAEGYVAARDHLCNISHIVLRAKGELSQTFGTGPKNGNFLSDYAARGLGMREKYQVGFSQQPAAFKQMLTGYAAGFNKYLADDESRADHTHWCRGEEWVKPLSPLDLYARARYIIETLPQVGSGLYAAKPPSADTASIDPEHLRSAAAALNQKGFGSNAWAIGKDVSESGGGMLLANPHYPWFGSNRFWEKHLTIPGELDVYGVSLVGTPGISIGFNQHIAWSHTVSDSKRVVVYRLTLNPEDPTQYLYEGEFRQLKAHTFSVPVKDANGQISNVPARMYHSVHGPLISLPGMAWTDKAAYAARDANRDNDSAHAQWYDMGRATDMASFKAAHARWNALPWVNTIAVSRDGQASYIDTSSVGHLSQTAIAAWKAAYAAGGPIKTAYDEANVVVLDGSRAKNNFLEDGSPLPGTVPYAQRPQMTRSDYVFNANDSYWLSSPRAPMDGFSPLYGLTATKRSLRTRQNILLLEDGAARGQDGKWSLRELQTQILSNASLAATLFLSELIGVCEDGATFPAALCNTLKAYDGHLNLGSTGAIVFREWLVAYIGLCSESGVSVFAIPFSADNPIHTPSGLGNKTMAAKALVAAVELLTEALIPFNAALGDVQVALRGQQRIPMHGGLRSEGVANLINQRRNDTGAPQDVGVPYATKSGLSDEGYLVSGGTSFLMTLAFGADGPSAEAVLTYGQSGTPGNPNYHNQTTLFANKTWRKIFFDRDEIEANAIETFSITGQRDLD